MKTAIDRDSWHYLIRFARNVNTGQPSIWVEERCGQNVMQAQAIEPDTWGLIEDVVYEDVRERSGRRLRRNAKTIALTPQEGRGVFFLACVCSGLTAYEIQHAFINWHGLHPMERDWCALKAKTSDAWLRAFQVALVENPTTWPQEVTHD